jgi:hypothetical protein
MTFAALSYAANYSTGYFMAGTPLAVKYILAAIGAIINGIGASFLWTSVGSYIHKVCHKYDRINQKGHYYGMFNAIFCCSAIFGAVVATYGMTHFSHQYYFAIVTVVACLAFLFGIFFIIDI